MLRCRSQQVFELPGSPEAHELHPEGGRGSVEVHEQLGLLGAERLARDGGGEGRPQHHAALVDLHHQAELAQVVERWRHADSSVEQHEVRNRRHYEGAHLPYGLNSATCPGCSTMVSGDSAPALA